MAADMTNRVGESAAKQLVKWGVGIVEAQFGLPPNPITQDLAADAIGPPAWAAVDRVRQTFRFGKVARTIQNLQERCEREGVEVDAEPMIYLLDAAIPQVEEASSETKRQMMEDVIFSAARGGGADPEKVAADRIGATFALSFIDAMDDSVALSFAHFLKLARDGAPKEWGKWEDARFTDSSFDVGIAPFLADRARDLLFGRHGNAGVPTNRYAFALIEGGEPGQYRFSDFGKWFGRWLVDHHAPPPPG